MSHYIVSFRPGTSGRFVSSIVWMILHPNWTDLKITPQNSCHWENPWMSTWVYEDKVNENRVGWCHTPKVYENWEFNCDDLGLLHSHTYPDTDAINKHLPNTKVILITYSNDDLLEIITNDFYKNIVPAAREGLKKDFIWLATNKFYVEWYLKHIKLYNKPFELTPEGFTDEFVSELIKDRYVYYLNDSKNDVFTRFNEEVFHPESDDNFLTIKYNDIFKESVDGSYVALDQIRNWLSYSESNPTLLNSYKAYVDNRNHLLNKVPKL